MYNQQWGYGPPPPFFILPSGVPATTSAKKAGKGAKSFIKQMQEWEAFLKLQEEKKKNEKGGKPAGPDVNKGHVFTVFQLWMFLTIFGLPMGLAHLWFTHALYKAATEFFKAQFQ